MSHELAVAIASAGSVLGLCLTQKLAAVKMAIRTEGDSQKAVAIDAGIDQAQLTRKLSDAEPLTFRDFEKLPEEVQRAALLEMLAQMGLPQRARRWMKVGRVVEMRERESA